MNCPKCGIPNVIHENALDCADALIAYYATEPTDTFQGAVRLPGAILAPLVHRFHLSKVLFAPNVGGYHYWVNCSCGASMPHETQYPGAARSWIIAHEPDSRLRDTSCECMQGLSA